MASQFTKFIGSDHIYNVLLVHMQLAQEALTILNNHKAGFRQRLERLSYITAQHIVLDNTPWVSWVIYLLGDTADFFETMSPQKKKEVITDTFKKASEIVEDICGSCKK